MENHKTDDRMEDLMQKVREGRGTDAASMLDYCTQIEEYAERAGGCQAAWIFALLQGQNLLS